MKSAIRRAVRWVKTWLTEPELTQGPAGDEAPGWLQQIAAYVSIDPTAILGANAQIDIKFRPLTPAVCVTIGAESQLFGSLVVQRPGASISIGRRCQIGASLLVAADSIVIGDDVLMAWNVTIMDNDSHSLDWSERSNDVAQCAKDYHETPMDFARNKDWSVVPIAPIRIEEANVAELAAVDDTTENRPLEIIRRR